MSSEIQKRNIKFSKETPFNLKTIKPASLAFMGDTVYETLAREYLIRNFGVPPSKLHEACVALVNAGAQSDAVEYVLPILTDEERDVLRRGRNINPSHVPKNASPIDYRRATGLEALFGWLYLNGKKSRAREIFGEIVKVTPCDGPAIHK